MRDLATCILRSVLQAALVPMQRLLDDILEQIHDEEEEEEEEEWEDEDEEEGEGKGLIHIDLPGWTLYFRNFEGRVLVNVARSLGTKTIHYSVLDPLALMFLYPRTVDRLTKVGREGGREGGRVCLRNFEWRVNVTRSLGTKTIHCSVLDPLALMFLYPRTVDRLTKVGREGGRERGVGKESTSHTQPSLPPSVPL